MEILDELLKFIPDKSKISDTSFEGANIILYTKDKDFFLDSNGVLKEIVNSIKKRVELRPDPSITMDLEKTKEVIEKLTPSEAGLTNILFDPQRSLVIIEAEKPGLVIGKQGDLLKEIKKQTLWIPIIRRAPPIKSKIIENIRQVLYENNDYRKKFLNKVGKRIYGGWTRNKQNEWVRISFLGAGRQVGRSCFFLQTPESRVLIDCGINVAAQGSDQYPMLEAPEFNLEQLDAVILSHPHVDHCLPPHTLVELEKGVIKPIDDVKEGDKLISIDWKTNKRKISKCTNKIKTTSHKTIYRIHTPYFTIESSPNHRFFILDGYDVKEVRADELKRRMIVPAQLGRSRNTKQIQLKPVSYNERIFLPRDAIRKLKETRKKIGWSQKWVRKRLDRGVNFLYKLEKKSSHILNHNLRELLQFYNINEEKFFNEYNLQETTYPLKITNELAQCIGYITGDGHESSPRCLRITDKSMACLNEYESLFSKIFNCNPKIRNHVDKTKNAFQLNINNKGILKYLKTNFDTSFNKSREKLVPGNILFSSNDSIKGFLRGFFDAEGCVLKSNISVASSSKKMLETIQFLLSSIGIPATIDYKNTRVSVSGLYSLKKFCQEINFTHPDKKIKLRNLLKRKDGKDEGTYEFLPINSNLLNQIFIDTKIKGTLHNSPNMDNLPLCLVDLYRRKSGYCEKRTVKILIDVLNKRRNDLKIVLNSKNIYKKRIAISLPKRELSKISQVTAGRISVREGKYIYDKYYKLLIKKLDSLIKHTILKTQRHIKELNKLLDSDIFYQKITKIEKIKNPYDYLVDIEVDKTHNFMANGLVVHNSAFIPWLYKMGFKGPCYMTEPTRDIAAILCLDTIELAQKDASKALYSSKDVKEMVRHTIPLEYEEVTDITPDIRITLYNAGHTLGSSVVHIHIGNGMHNLVYTGDYKFLRTELLEPAINKFPRVETIITEATYGSKEDVLPARKVCEDEIIDTIKKTVERNGKVLIPVLGVGRSQEIMLILEKVIREGLLEKIPIYVQGMVWDITAIHTAYPDYLNRNVRNSIFHRDHNPFLSDIFARIVSRKEQDDVIENSGPCVLLATSGMMSVDANEQILVKNSNKLKITKVGEIIDRTISQSKKKAIIVGETNGEMAIPNNNLQVPCYNFKNGKLEFKPVSVVIKHRVDKPIYKIKLKSGREVKVTGSHSVMIFKDGYITSKKVEDLTKEDNIVVNKLIEQNKEGINKISLIEKLLDNCPEKILRKIYIKNDKNAKDYTSWGKRYRTSSLFNYNKETKLSEDAKIGLKAATDLTIPHKLNTTKELSRLLGYFVSEGCYYMSKFRNGDVKLVFGIHESHLVRDATKCIEKCFGVKPKILEDKNKNTLTVQLGSKLFAYIFKYAFGCTTKAGKKRVPSLVFNLKEDFQKEFLKGYFLGDGSLYDKNNKTTITFTSKSKSLMSDISLLLSLNDIPVHKISTIRKQRRVIKNRMVRKSTLYKIQITNPKYINKLNLLDYKIKRNRIPIEVNPFSVPVEEIKVLFNDLKPNKALRYLKWSILSRKRITYERLDKLIKVLRKTPNNKRLLGSLEKISKGYLGFDKIDGIKKTKSSNNYVYDFSIKGAENFLAGHGGVLLHNTGGASVEYFRRLADNPKNTIMFVNYLGEGSLGRRIQNGESEVQVPGERGMETVKVNMEVKTIAGLSGHAGRAELIRYLSTCDPKPKKVIIVHGESSKCLDLASSIHKSIRVETNAPKNLEAIRLR